MSLSTLCTCYHSVVSLDQDQGSVVCSKYKSTFLFDSASSSCRFPAFSSMRYLVRFYFFSHSVDVVGFCSCAPIYFAKEEGLIFVHDGRTDGQKLFRKDGGSSASHD